MRIGQRATLLVDDGDYAGAQVTVDQLVAWPLLVIARSYLDAYYAAEDQSGELAALRKMYEFYEAEARPAWNIEDQRGPVPPNLGGLLHLPLELSILIYTMWMQTFPAVEAEVTPEAEPEAA